MVGFREYFLIKEENQITVYFGLHFDDRFEQQLGKIFFSVFWSLFRS